MSHLTSEVFGHCKALAFCSIRKISGLLIDSEYSFSSLRDQWCHGIGLYTPFMQAFRFYQCSKLLNIYFIASFFVNICRLKSTTLCVLRQKWTARTSSTAVL